MAKRGTLLIVDDNRNILSAVKLLADGFFAKVVTLSSPTTLLSTIAVEKPNVLLLDMNFHAGINTGNEGIFWLNEVITKFPEIKVVLFTAYGDISLAVKAMKHGAFDFVVKPWNNDKLMETLLNALEQAMCKGKKQTVKPVRKEVPMFWGESAEMEKIRAMVERVALTDANVLITGENGTGKELLAREIHRLSARCGKEMISLDMGAIPETLFESEFFGHKKGAFTDAHADRPGKMVAANGSTLFMDEIGNLPLHLQAKMLVALQNRMVTPLGGNAPQEIDVRVIAATNRDLYSMVDNGEFRQDLLYRINTVHINLPPLRKRQVDIVPLAGIFLKHYCEKYGKELMSISNETTTKLMAHPYDGNIRELQNIIEKAVIMCDGGDIQPEHLQLYVSSGAARISGSTLEDMERTAIAEAISSCGGNLSMVAQKLGITRQTLYNKIKRYGL
ncbi:MAG: sigma-54-dependent Fis family transcriptional regulator [Bacteroidaceae bacterium]|nr:sigma-54-dependent Fis family transcriptional regulator [Bacteroidaceae bacterium]